MAGAALTTLTEPSRHGASPAMRTSSKTPCDGAKIVWACCSVIVFFPFLRRMAGRRSPLTCAPQGGTEGRREQRQPIIPSHPLGTGARPRPAAPSPPRPSPGPNFLASDSDPGSPIPCLAWRADRRGSAGGSPRTGTCPRPGSPPLSLYITLFRPRGSPSLSRRPFFPRPRCIEV